MLQLAVLVWRVLGKGEEPRNEGEREREQEGDLIFLQVRSRDASLLVFGTLKIKLIFSSPHKTSTTNKLVV
jgi:hypothetical protein